MALPPLSVLEWTYLAQALKIPVQASGSSMISVLNGWQNMTALQVASTGDATQNAWGQMVSYVQALETEQVTLLQDTLASWAALAYGDQAFMDNGAIDSAASGITYGTGSQIMTFVGLIKSLVPVYQAGDNVGPTPTNPPMARNASFSFGR